MTHTIYSIETLQFDSLWKVPQNMQIWKPCDKKWHHNDVIIKTMENADVLETSQIIYHSKGLDESFPKM